MHCPDGAASRSSTGRQSVRIAPARGQGQVGSGSDVEPGAARLAKTRTSSMLNLRAGQDCSIWKKQREAEGCVSHMQDCKDRVGRRKQYSCERRRAPPRSRARGARTVPGTHTAPGCSAETRVVPRSGNTKALSQAPYHARRAARSSSLVRGRHWNQRLERSTGCCLCTLLRETRAHTPPRHSL
jgi:hypothetical protein